MSQETSSTTSYEVTTVPPQVLLLAAAVARHADATGLTWQGSQELVRLATPDLRMRTPLSTALPAPLATARARRSALAEAPIAEALARLTCPDLMAQADTHLAASLRHHADGREADATRAARDGDAAVRRALAAAAAAVRPEERLLTVSIAERALGAMGCAVQRADGRRTSALWATRGDVVIALVVEDGGIVHRDIAGCEGGGCSPVGSEVDAQMAAHGARLAHRRQTVHGDAAGGSRIDRAAQVVEDGGWATALVQQEEVGLPAGVAPTASAPVAPRIGQRTV